MEAVSWDFSDLHRKVKTFLWGIPSCKIRRQGV